VHYRRKCLLVAPCCGEVFWCRHCHNEVKYDNVTDPNAAHQLDRKLVQQVVCSVCCARQPIAGACRECGQCFGEYYCVDCRFFDDDTSKQQFHCAGCGLCRVGGRENYFHCSKCVACLPLSMRANHKCIDQSLHVNCPVCLDFLHSSLQTATILPCGHALHSKCQQELFKAGVGKCPICSASMMDLSERWRQMDDAVAHTPMPEEYRSMRVSVLCNDWYVGAAVLHRQRCLFPVSPISHFLVHLQQRTLRRLFTCSHARSSVIFHVVGLKCGECGGYNTRRIGDDEGGGEGGDSGESEGGSGLVDGSATTDAPD
jgi:RING finger and CHY zinc finger domain-containing protein 1